MLLQQELDRFSAEMIQQVPSEILAAFGNATQELVALNIPQFSKKKGKKAPNFALPNIDGQIVNLYDALKKGPVILCFYRGVWCPYCNLELAAWQKTLPQIQKLGAQLIAVSAQKPEFSKEMAEKHGVSFEVLSDQGNLVSEQYGIVFTLAESMHPVYTAMGIDIPTFNGDDSFRLPLPATYVIQQDGIVAYSFVDADYSRRAEPAEVLSVLEIIDSAALS